MSAQKSQKRTKLLDAARDVIRAKGYSAATVEDICAAAGVTKGSFFYHFASKDELAVAAIEQFGVMASAIFSSAPYNANPDPRERLLGYIDFRASMFQWDIVQFTCLVGTTVQEVHVTHPELRSACDRVMSAHIADVARDLEAAKRKYAPDAQWSAEGVSNFIQAVLQGAFILAKTKQSSEVATESLRHLRHYLETLLQPSSGARHENKQEESPSGHRLAS